VLTTHAVICALLKLSFLVGAPVVIRPAYPWAALYNTWLLTKLTLKGAVFSFLFCWFAMTTSADSQFQGAAAVSTGKICAASAV